MLMIFEGQARTGKSSTIQRVADIFTQVGIPTFIRKSYKRDDYFGYLVNDVLPMAQDNVNLYLLDRAHISEIVYRTNEDGLDFEDYRDLIAFDRVLAKLGTVMIHMVADEPELILRHLFTGRGFEGDIRVIRMLFDMAVADSFVPTLKVDTEDFADVNDLAEALVTFFLSDVSTGD